MNEHDSFEYSSQWNPDLSQLAKCRTAVNAQRIFNHSAAVQRFMGLTKLPGDVCLLDGNERIKLFLLNSIIPVVTWVVIFLFLFSYFYSLSGGFTMWLLHLTLKGPLSLHLISNINYVWRSYSLFSFIHTYFPLPSYIGASVFNCFLLL